MTPRASASGSWQRATCAERIDTGQILAGAPETVLRQAEAIQRALGAGILELAFIGPTPDKRRRSLELFGTRVLPRMREL